MDASIHIHFNSYTGCQLHAHNVNRIALLFFRMFKTIVSIYTNWYTLHFDSDNYTYIFC